MNNGCSGRCGHTEPLSTARLLLPRTHTGACERAQQHTAVVAAMDATMITMGRHRRVRV